MKIVYDNIIFSIQKSGGISVVWYELIKRLLNEKSVVTEFIEYASCQSNIFRKKLQIEESSIKTYKWNYLKRYFNTNNEENTNFIFHSSYYRISRSKKAINITTVHDFTYELYRKGIRKWIHSYQKLRAIKHSDYIICVSENTKKDLLSFLPDINLDIIYVIHNGVSENYFPLNNPNIFEFKNLRLYEYVIFIGLRDDHKRFDFAVKLSDRLNKKLLIVGGGDLNKSELAFLDSNIKTYLHFSRPSDSELNVLYNFAYCLIYPSEYEGFGIPIIEAQRAGCPVIAYNSGAIKEVAGNNPLLFDTFDLETIAVKTENYLSDATKRKQIVSDGIKNAANYSWDYTYNKTLELYKKAINYKK